MNFELPLIQQAVDTIIGFAKNRQRGTISIYLGVVSLVIGGIIFLLASNQFTEVPPKLYLVISVLFIAFGLVVSVFGFYRVRKFASQDIKLSVDKPSAIKGPLSFTPSDGELFRHLGREAVLKELLGYVEDDQVCLITLMGASGAGKTSLLRAGLTDIIKDKHIKFHYWEAVPSDSEQRLLKAVQKTWFEPSSTKNNLDRPNSLEDLLNPPDQPINKHIIVIDQLEQLRADGQIFKLLRRLIRETEPPYYITWIVAFRREFAANWGDFIIPERKLGFSPREINLQLFTPVEAKRVISHLCAAAELKVEDGVVNNLVEAVTVDGEVSCVDIGIGVQILSELSSLQKEETATEEYFHFVGGAEGLLTQYIDKHLGSDKKDREIVLNAMLALRDSVTDQRFAEGKSVDYLASETKTDMYRLKEHLERLTQRDVRLLEHVQQETASEELYRLPHERLIPALNRLAGTLLGEVEETRQKFENAFSVWKKKNIWWRHLLKDKDVRLVERHKSKIPWGKNNSEKLKFLKLSKRKRQLKVSLFIICPVILSYILLPIGIKYLYEKLWPQSTQARYLFDIYPSELSEYQKQLKILKLYIPLKADKFPWQCSNSENLEDLTIKTQDTNSLDDLATNLAGCPNLKKLSINLWLGDVASLEPLAKLTNLTQLEIKLGRRYSLDGKKISVEPLTKLNKLERLKLALSPYEISDLDTLSLLPDHTQISLTFSELGITDYELKKLSNLLSRSNTSLDFSSSWVYRLEEISNAITNVFELKLHLSENEYSSYPNKDNNLEPLSSLQNLNDLNLDLTRSRVTDLEPLTKLNKLTKLNLNIKNSLIRDLAPLIKVKNLTQLNLSINGFQITYLESLGYLTNLTELNIDLAGNKMSILKQLPQLPKNVQLNIIAYDEHIADLESLNDLANLSQLNLDLKSTKSTNIEPLSKLTNLKKLDLNISGSEILDLHPLSELKNLTLLKIDLTSTKIENLDALGALTNLSILDINLAGTKINNLDPVLKLNCQILYLGLSDQRMSLKTIPKKTTELRF